MSSFALAVGGVLVALALVVIAVDVRTDFYYVIATFFGCKNLLGDATRALVSDGEDDPTATDDAFAVLHFIAGKRLVEVGEERGDRRAPAGRRPLRTSYRIRPSAWRSARGSIASAA